MRLRFELGRSLQILGSFGTLALFGQQQAEVQIALEDVGLGRDCLAISSDRVHRTLQRVVDVAQIEPGAIVIGFGGDSLLQEGFGGCEIVALHCRFRLVNLGRAALLGRLLHAMMADGRRALLGASNDCTAENARDRQAHKTLGNDSQFL